MIWLFIKFFRGFWGKYKIFNLRYLIILFLLYEIYFDKNSHLNYKIIIFQVLQ